MADRYEVEMDNRDRGHNHVRRFSILYDAQKFYDSYKLTPGETIELREIVDRQKPVS